jgi:hypothetical protein
MSNTRAQDLVLNPFGAFGPFLGKSAVPRLARVCILPNFGATLMARSGVDRRHSGWLRLVTVETVPLPPKVTLEWVSSKKFRPL